MRTSSIPENFRTVITFEQGAQLEDAARAALDDLIAQPAFASGEAITLSGHSDTSGSDADNLATSRCRAEAVRDRLISLGVAEDWMTVIALGERRAISPNAKPDGSDDPEGRRRNRRVEVVVTSARPPQTVGSPRDGKQANSVQTSDPTASRTDVQKGPRSAGSGEA